MVYTSWKTPLATELQDIAEAGLLKRERLIASPQGAHVIVGGKNYINLCANNYLGLADHDVVVDAAKHALDEYGYGTASVRFICGTQDIHRDLEQALAKFLGTEDSILFGSCFDANGGVFEVLLSEEDAVISDALNHASIIDGIRLSRAARYRYANSDMAELEKCLQESQSARRRLIVTDGVFSMDGYLAKLPEICALAEKYDALVMVDDSHAVGFLGETGRGSAELQGVADKIDLYSGTLGKALGGASGGYISGRQEIVDLLRQRARPYLFSNSVPPPVVAASLAALNLLKSSGQLRDQLKANTVQFRQGMQAAGFELLPGPTPIVPVMFGDARAAAEFAERLLSHGVYAVAFSFPVVPKGQARIRTQMSAAHSSADIDQAIAAFISARNDK